MEYEEPEDPKIADIKDICTSIREDDATLLEDIALLKKKIPIYYAVDFTEIFCFIHSAPQNISLFGGYERRLASDIALNQVILDSVFFSKHYNMILIPPYELEYNRYIESFARYEIGELSSVIDEVLHGDFRKSLSYSLEVAKSWDSRRDLNADETKGVIEEVCDNAPALLILARKEHLRPEALLRDFGSTAAINKISDVLHAEILPGDLNENSIDAYFSALKRIRKKYPAASNRIDAYALAYVGEMNARLGDSGHVRLLTRSEAMHSLPSFMKDDSAARQAVRGLLRRPQSFATFIAAGQDVKLSESLARERLATLDAVLLGIRKSKTGELTKSILNKFRDLQEQFKKLESLTISQGLTESSYARRNRDDQENYGLDMEKLFGLLVNDAHIKQAIKERSKDLMERISSDNIALSMELLKSNQDRLQAVRDQVNVERKPRHGRVGQVFVIRSGLRDFPYTLQFYDLKPKRPLEKVFEQDEALRTFIRQTSVGTEYEKRLAFAFVLAASGLWAEASGFCQAAIEAAVDDQVPRHEGYYFRALCRRHDAPLDHTNIARSLADLDRATVIKRRLRSQDDYDDPRYLRERGLQLAALANLDPGADDDGVDAPPADPRAVWERALALVEDDVLLRLSLLNNLCFWHFEQGTDEGMRVALSYRDRIFAETERASLDLEDLAPGTIHTLVWVTWSSGRDDERLPRPVMISLLKAVLDSEFVSTHDRDMVRQHLQAIETYGDT